MCQIKWRCTLVLPDQRAQQTWRRMLRSDQIINALSTWIGKDEWNGNHLFSLPVLALKALCTFIIDGVVLGFFFRRGQMLDQSVEMATGQSWARQPCATELCQVNYCEQAQWKVIWPGRVSQDGWAPVVMAAEHSPPLRWHKVHQLNKRVYQKGRDLICRYNFNHHQHIHTFSLVSAFSLLSINIPFKQVW